jgi:hypothetical protein
MAHAGLLFFRAGCPDCKWRTRRHLRQADARAEMDKHFKAEERGRTVTNFTGFVDVIAANSSKVPVVKGGIVALYATGSSIIEATASEIARFKTGGCGVILIDQTPDQLVLAAGLADVGDIESLAGTYGAAVAACKARAAHNWMTTLYVGYDNIAALEAALTSGGVDMSLVRFGVANYNWSIDEAQQLLAQTDSWVYVQYGDNITNAGTPIPGSNPVVTCGEASCDIDVAKKSWADLFTPQDPAVSPHVGIVVYAVDGLLVHCRTVTTTDGKTWEATGVKANKSPAHPGNVTYAIEDGLVIHSRAVTSVDGGATWA